jgi:hypothetical protein
MANTRVLDVDENFIWAGLLDWNLLVLDGTAGLLDDLRPLFLRNGTHFYGLKLIRKMYYVVDGSSSKLIDYW